MDLLPAIDLNEGLVTVSSSPNPKLTLAYDNEGDDGGARRALVRRHTTKTRRSGVAYFTLPDLFALCVFCWMAGSLGGEILTSGISVTGNCIRHSALWQNSRQ